MRAAARAKANHDSNDHEPRRRSGRLSQAVDVRPQPPAPPAARQAGLHRPGRPQHEPEEQLHAEVSPVGGAAVRHQPGLDRGCLTGHGWSGFRAGSSLGPTDDSSPIRYGQSVALGYGTSPSYIYYAERTFGINLDWSAMPRFDWKLLGGKTGQEVRSGDWLALYNQTARDCLIYFDRDRRRRHRVARQRDLDRTDRGRCYASHQRPLEGSSGLSPGCMSGARPAAWVPGPVCTPLAGTQRLPLSRLRPDIWPFFGL